MTATIVQFPMREQSVAANGVDARRETARKVRADLVRQRMEQRTRIEGRDRVRLVFNLGTLMGRWFDNPKKRVSEVFREAFGNEDVVSSKLKKRKNWIRFSDEPAEEPFAADRRDFLRLTEAIAALAKKPASDALLALVRGSSLDESGIAHDSVHDEAIHEVLTAVTSAMNRIRRESRIDSYFQAMSSDLLKTDPYERWEAGDGIPFSPGSLQDRFAQGGWFADIAVALPRISLGVLFRPRPVHFFQMEPADLAGMTTPPTAEILAAAYHRGPYATALAKAEAALPGGNALAFESYRIDLVITPRARGNVIEPALAISIEADDICASPLRQSVISAHGAEDGTQFVSWNDGVSNAVAFLRYPRTSDSTQPDWLDIDGLEGGDDIAVIDRELCRSFLLRKAAFSSAYEPAVPDEGWLRLETLFANAGGLTPPVSAPTLGAAILRNLAFAADGQRLDDLMIAEVDRRASELDDWIRQSETGYRNAMRERFGRFKAHDDGEPL